MDEATEVQWYVICKSAAALSGIGFGNVSIRIENGKPTGLIEVRETLKVDAKKCEDVLNRVRNN